MHEMMLHDTKLTQSCKMQTADHSACMAECSMAHCCRMQPTCCTHITNYTILYGGRGG